MIYDMRFSTAHRASYETESSGQEFEYMTFGDVDSSLMANAPENSLTDDFQPLVRVLLREGIESGNLTLSIVGGLDWNDHNWSIVDLRSPLVPEFLIRFAPNAWALHNGEDLPPYLVGRDPFQGSWTEFVVAGAVFDAESLRELTDLHFEMCLADEVDCVLCEGILGPNARFDPEELTEDEEEVVDALCELWRDRGLCPAPLREAAAEGSDEEFAGAICEFLRNVWERLSGGDVQDLLALNHEWGDVPDFIRHAPVRLTYSVGTPADSMGWRSLTEQQQLVVLRDAPEWVAALAAFVPGTKRAVLDMLKGHESQFVRDCLDDLPGPLPDGVDSAQSGPLSARRNTSVMEPDGQSASDLTAALLCTSTNLEGAFDVECGLVSVGTRVGPCPECGVLPIECEACGTPGLDRIVVSAGRSEGLYPVFRTSHGVGEGSLVIPLSAELTPTGTSIDLQGLQGLAMCRLGRLGTGGAIVIADAEATYDTRNAILKLEVAAGYYDVFAWIKRGYEGGAHRTPIAVGISSSSLVAVAENIEEEDDIWPEAEVSLFDAWGVLDNDMKRNVSSSFAEAGSVNASIEFKRLGQVAGPIPSQQTQEKTVLRMYSWVFSTLTQLENYQVPTRNGNSLFVLSDLGDMRESIQATRGLEAWSRFCNEGAVGANELLQILDDLREMASSGAELGIGSNPELQAHMLAERCQLTAAIAQVLPLAAEGNQVAQVNIAFWSSQLGDLEAVEYWAEMALSNSSNPDLVANATNTLAFCVLIPQGRFDEARSKLESVATYDAGRQSRIAVANLGILEFKAGNLDAAERILRDVLSRRVLSVDEALYYLSLIEEARGNASEAQGMRDRLVSEFPGSTYHPDRVRR